MRVRGGGRGRETMTKGAEGDVMHRAVYRVTYHFFPLAWFFLQEAMNVYCDVAKTREN